MSMKRLSAALAVLSFAVNGVNVATAATAPTRWVPLVDGLSTGRSNGCSVLLADGRLFLAGGLGNGGPLASTEFLGSDGRFHDALPMRDARIDQACAALPDGALMVAGGRTFGGAILNSVELYDVKTGRWRSARSMVEGRAGATVSVLADGRVLIAGGESAAGVSDSMEIYDPRTSDFRHVAQRLSSPRREHAAAILPDGRVLIAGGSDGSKALDTTDLFDPKTETIVYTRKMAVARAGLTATTLLEGRVVILGGSNGTTEIGAAELFDPRTGEFKVDGAFMTTARRNHFAFRIPGNNTLLIAGGTSAGRALAETELYQPWKHRFQRAGELESARTALLGSPLLQRGKVVVAGGRNETGSQSSAALLAAPTIWTDKADYAPGEKVTFSGSGW